MITIKRKKTIDFHHITLQDKELYQTYLSDGKERGCEFSFANLYLWGRQNIAFAADHAVLFSEFDRRSVYPYPVGSGDKRAVIDAIIEDSRARGISCRITGILASDKQELERLYPDMFSFYHDEGTFDYIYSIDDLADLKGKKYHGKRNHINRFCEEFPDYTVEAIGEDNVSDVRRLAEDWYRERAELNPNVDHHLEQEALYKALREYRELGMEGLILSHGGEVLAMTLGSRMSEDTVDVHFEKARSDVSGVYTMINREFAAYIRDKYPEIKYFDREEDMGLEGLRKAKRSYHPHHMIEKYWACLAGGRDEDK